MKVLVDTNIILDILFHRAPFYDDSRIVYTLVEQGRITGYISSSAMTDIFYLARKELKDTDAVYKIMDTLAADFIIAPVLESAIKSALALRWKDFEDAVHYTAARENGIEHIIIRNATDVQDVYDIWAGIKGLCEAKTARPNVPQ
ncbi:MAG: PIN domain-containing protein [Spirochaetales bacterium]|jgi:predicted nucleic acid-binding protein|nr:PIN domain-containing protein [Spirochaetales bacterium]